MDLAGCTTRVAVCRDTGGAADWRPLVLSAVAVVALLAVLALGLLRLGRRPRRPARVRRQVRVWRNGELEDVPRV